MYNLAQWCYRPVSADADKNDGVACSFKSKSKTNYTGNLYCLSTDGFFYKTAK